MILTDYSVKLRITVFVLTAILLVAGPLMYLGLPREGAPDITIPYVFVTAPYEGVAPAEIENLITIPMEKRFNGLENIEEMRSTASEGVSVTVIKFLPRQNIDLAIQKVKDKIDLARPDLPQDLDEPTVQGLNFSTDIPVLKMAVSGDTDLARLKEIAEDLQDAVERIPGVLEAKLYGAREREIRVDVDVQRLTAYALTLGDVAEAIQKENSTVSAGNLNLPGGKFQLRIPGEFTDAMAMRDIVVKTENGHPLHLTDVAEVSDTYKDVTSISRVNGRPCVALAIHKRAGENTDALIRQVKKTVAGGALPPGIEATIVDDQS